MMGAGMPPRPLPPWWVRPAIVLPSVGVLVVLVALLAPSPLGPRTGDGRLSTLSSAPLGARLLLELSGRLGWEPERRMTATLDSTPGLVQAVLEPVIALRSTETHALLEYVRRGGAALVVVGPTMQHLMDSLHLELGRGGVAIAVERNKLTCGTDKREGFASLWFGQSPTMLTLRWLAPAPAGTITLLRSRLGATGASPDSLRPTVVAFAYGNGRMVISADADVFRNDAMRECGPGFDVVAVRSLEFLRDGGAVPRRRLVFDEYHQAHGAHPGTVRAALRYLGDSPSGRLLAQLTIAGLLLLVATAPRTVPPRDDRRVERRSPLEQVDALARAYAHVRATRTATQRLIRGLRRRIERGTARDRAALSDDAWLARAGALSPAIAADTARARRALAETITPREFAEVGPALHHIESTLTHR